LMWGSHRLHWLRRSLRRQPQPARCRKHAHHQRPTKLPHAFPLSQFHRQAYHSVATRQNSAANRTSLTLPTPLTPPTPLSFDQP
jgi:hypothetical protein